MNAPLIPVTIDPRAAGYVKEHGVEHVMERLIQHALETVPEVRGIDVELKDELLAYEDPYVLISVRRPDRPDEVRAEENANWVFTQWEVRNFSPEELTHFSVWCC